VVIERGQIYWCSLDPVRGHEQGATRPVVVVSSDPYNRSQSPLAAVVPLTKSPVKNPIHIRLSPEDTGLDEESTALTDHARFIDRSRLRGEPAGRLKASAMALVNRHLTRVLGL
jgi:mRNA interferase MazF